MKQSVWLYSIRTFTILISLVICFSSCKKKVKKVNVSVCNESTGIGIPGIKVFFDSEEYTTNSEGKVEIKKSRDIKDEFVTTYASIPNYVNAEYPSSCETKNAYKIESEDLTIPLAKVKKVKVTIKKANGGSLTESMCISFDPLLNCSNDEITENIRLINDVLIEPLRAQNGAVYYGVAESTTGAELKLYRNSDCKSLGKPDTTFSIPTITNKDTIDFIILVE